VLLDCMSTAAGAASAPQDEAAARPEARGQHRVGSRRFEGASAHVDAGRGDRRWCTQEPGTLWIHSVPQDIIDSVDDMERKRQEAINEAICTERDFLGDRGDAMNIGLSLHPFLMRSCS
jgi:hypothetical protein